LFGTSSTNFGSSSIAHRDRAGALRDADGLEAYTEAEPPPVMILFLERGRALAAALEGPPDAQLRQTLARIVAAMRDLELTPFLSQVEAPLAPRPGAIASRGFLH